MRFGKILIFLVTFFAFISFFVADYTLEWFKYKKIEYINGLITNLKILVPMAAIASLVTALVGPSFIRGRRAVLEEERKNIERLKKK